MTNDEFTTARYRDAVDATNELLRWEPLQRNECFVFVAGEREVWRGSQDALAGQARADDLRAFERDVRRAVIPVGHALLVFIGVETELLVLRLEDLHNDAEPAPHGASALALLGTTAVGVRR